jgi:cardiolipin synthase
MDRALIEQMEQAGVLIRWFRPITRFHPGRMNHRTHRKVVVIDEAVGFTGGVGIADEWKGDARNEHEWRDTHFRVDGPAVDGLRAAFLADWAKTDRDLVGEGVDRFPEQEQPGHAVVQCVRSAGAPVKATSRCSPPHAAPARAGRLRITTAYFVPDDDLAERLGQNRRSRRRRQGPAPGPAPDKRFVRIAAESTFEGLLDRGIRIASFQPSMLHAKIVTVDGMVAAIGSANFNARSVSLDDEINLVVIERGLVDQLDDHFEADLTRSIQLDARRWRHRPLVKRMVERAVAPCGPSLDGQDLANDIGRGRRVDRAIGSQRRATARQEDEARITRLPRERRSRRSLLLRATERVGAAH